MNSIGLSRRSFLRYGMQAGAAIGLCSGLSLVSVASTPLRPPGVAAGADMAASCIRCGNCVEVCPARALEQKDISLDIRNTGTPVLNPNRGGCTAWKEPCGKCAEVCPTGALDKKLPLESQVLGTASIREEGCVNCMLCFEKCPVQGAVLFPNPDGPPYTRAYDIPSGMKMKYAKTKPYIKDDRCVGCGLCAHYCPVKVIDVKPV
ncbi:4Fe-4S dicluster domain-containing protein [Desulforhopalus singaporensis]|uniref:Ferredoxin-type protein NapG n=1 Tax=Desulforhopalus singaporensis TaxID=91360 RepID=A0A1H0RXL5_9BACT|nr:4Fe-4S dicluster domain-containing protein [Desulforhopalus singaporensis]SDP34312.1 ferredoxin-type protein NapG [Desulforhopalus singaporensis]